MSSLFNHTLARLIIPFTLVVAIGIAAPGRLAPQTNKELEWAEKHYWKVYRDLFPKMEILGDFVEYRFTETLHSSKGGALESYFLLGVVLSGKKDKIKIQLSAQFRAPDAIPIYNQIADLHHADSGAGVESIEKRIKMKSMDFTETSCPAIRNSFREFQELRFGPPYTNPDPGQMETIEDSALYQFKIEASHGSADITLFDETHPLVVWAMKTQRELEACASAKNPQK
jgi:hypothetical protein